MSQMLLGSPLCRDESAKQKTKESVTSERRVKRKANGWPGLQPKVNGCLGKTGEAEGKWLAWTPAEMHLRFLSAHHKRVSVPRISIMFNLLSS